MDASTLLGRFNEGDRVRLTADGRYHSCDERIRSHRGDVTGTVLYRHNVLPLTYRVKLDLFENPDAYGDGAWWCGASEIERIEEAGALALV